MLVIALVTFRSSFFIRRFKASMGFDSFFGCFLGAPNILTLYIFTSFNLWVGCYRAFNLVLWWLPKHCFTLQNTFSYWFFCSLRFTNSFSFDLMNWIFYDKFCMIQMVPVSTTSVNLDWNPWNNFNPCHPCICTLCVSVSPFIIAHTWSCTNFARVDSYFCLFDCVILMLCLIRCLIEN